MTDREVEARLRTALEHAAPNDLEGVLARCAPRVRTEPIPMKSAARKSAAGPRRPRPPAWYWP